MIAGVVVLHIWALHHIGQNNPTGIEPKGDKETVPFTPYATVKDGFMMSVFCVMFAWFVFYMPNYLGHADNYIPANPAVTPTHIVPEWYYLPFYAILRAIPNKLLGVAGAVRLDPDPRLPAVAGLLESALGALSPALQAILLDLLRGLHPARMARRQACRRRLCDRGAHPHDLLLRPLPGHPAAPRHVRETETACRIRFRNRCSAPSKA